MKELFKGKPLQVVEKLKKEIINEIKNIKLDDEDFECNGVEEIKEIVDIYLEIINGIYQDLLIEYIDENSVVGVYQDINGEIGYDKVGDDKNEK